MNKDKHVLPDMSNTYSKRIRQETTDEVKSIYGKTIYGPDNQPLRRVNTEMNTGSNDDLTDYLD